jgi:type IV pilus assembly protein PilQ
MRKGKRILLIAGVLVLSVNTASASLFRHRSAEKKSAPQAQAQPADAGAMTLTAIEIEQSPAPRIVLKTSASPAYTSYSPTPDVFVIDLTGAVKASTLTIPSTLPPSIASIAAEEVMEMGTRLTRVTFHLNQPGALQAAPNGNMVAVTLPAVTAPAAAPEQIAAVAPVKEMAIEPVAEPVRETAKVVEPEVIAEPIAANKAKTLRKVETNGAGPALQIQLSGDGALSYKALTLEQPSRLVIDLEGVKNKVAKTKIAVENSVVKGVRIAQFSDSVTRVVVDLDQKTPYHIAKAGERLVVSFGEAAASMPLPAATQAPATVAVSTPKTTAPAKTVAADIPSQVATVAETSSTWKMPPSASKGAKSVIRSGDQAAPPAPAPKPAPAPNPALARTPAQTSTTPVPSSGNVQPSASGTVIGGENIFGEPTMPGQQGNAGQGAASSTTITGGFLGGTRFLSGAERTYTGEPISLNLKDADIKDVLRTFAQLTGLNIAIDPGVTGSVTVDFVDVPWDQALDIILRQNGLSYVLEGNVMRIGTLTRLAAVAAATRALQEEERLNVPLTTVSFKLSYARASDVMGLLAQIASARGRIITDTRTNQLIITEIPTYLQVMRNLIESVDVPTRQVLIEARIVETSKTFSQQYGVIWGFQGSLDPALGTGTGLVFPNRIDFVGGPFSFGSGAPNVLSFHLGDVLGAFNLDVALTAAESEGYVRIVSAPRVVTQDNTPAQIQSGLQIPFQTRINFTTTISYVDATLNLSVIPQITEAGTVIMDIAVQKNEPAVGLTIEGAAGTPIQTRQARTRLMVRDGGTSVIGGIYQASDNRAETRLPFLHQIPVLGNLFKTHSIGPNRHDELLIFITPRILRTS